MSDHHGVAQLGARRETPSDPTVRRATRRRLVAVQGALVVMIAVSMLFGGAAVILGLLAVAAAHLVQVPLRRSVHDMADRSGDHIDERMESVRNHWFRVAYRILTPVVIIVGAGIFLAVEYGDLQVTPTEAQAAMWVTIVVVPYLPTWLIAWSEPLT